MRVRPLQRRRHDDAAAAVLARPSFCSVDERAADPLPSRALVDDEQRDLGQRRSVIDREAQVNRHQSDDLVAGHRHHHSCVGIGGQLRQPRRNGRRFDGIPELRTQPGDVGRVGRGSISYGRRIHGSVTNDTPRCSAGANVGQVRGRLA